MSTFSLENQLVPLDKILDKQVNNITFAETISLIFHAVISLAQNEFDLNHEKWKSLVAEFEKELDEQNSKKWPQMVVRKNGPHKRLDIFTTEPFNKSSSFLMLLFRLLSVENHKHAYLSKALDCYNYADVVSHTLKNDDCRMVRTLALDDIFKLFESQIAYYSSVYSDSMKFEYQLANCVLRQFG